MDEKSARADALVARIAARQYGVVTNRQLASAGLSKDEVHKRVRAGRLHRVHRCVYAVGHPGLSRQGHWMAAVLANGDGAVLSHFSAAALWGLLARDPNIVSVSLPRRGGRRRRDGIRLHRSSSLQSVHVTRRLGIPVTKPARTIGDLRRIASTQEIRQAIRQAEALGLPLDADVAEAHAVEGTRSELERKFLRLCRRHRLPAPEVNQRVGPYIVDFLWREQALIVETDGYRYHRGRQAFEDDRVRDLRLRRLGYEVLRISYRQLAQERLDVVSTLTGVLGRR